MKGPAPRSHPRTREATSERPATTNPMESLRRATPKRKRARARPTHTNSTDGLSLALVVHGAPRGLRFTGDVAALDNLNVCELARLARRGGR